MTPDERLAAVAMQYDGEDHEGERLLSAALRRLEYRARHGGKQCLSCREILPVSAFGADSSRRDGLRYYCRTCRSTKGETK
ncbi:hypothetical protein SEA_CALLINALLBARBZ_60 [Arthrobacter phage CallinAllBarbz]|uniref:HNH endonuclease n=1 Tax=Arthrobacter phage CallinAllBarbz TaxID=3077790 RepID=A0AA96HDA2_9CAUD|nr:hypothetical protein SEA_CALLINALLBARBZ_60 [Arthrobacter phage CallinAllBarbz]